jgi:hypothetical protein
MHAITTMILAQRPSATFECECCERPLSSKTLVWLELNLRTHEWVRPGKAPWSHGPNSQGCFSFGVACARRRLKEQS